MAVGGLIASDPALVGPAVAAVRACADGVGAVCRVPRRPRRRCSRRCPSQSWPSGPATCARSPRRCPSIWAGPPPRPPAGKFILVRPRSPARSDLARREGRAKELVGAVSVAGGASSHAAIVARGLGLPMLAGADPAVLAAAAGHQAILDAAAGELIVDPTATRPRPQPASRAAPRRTSRPRSRSGQPTASRSRCCATSPRPRKPGSACPAARRRRPAAHRDRLHRRLRLAVGGGHLAQLTPVLGLLAGRPAVVRLLDFSGDKVPPFLATAKTGAGRPAPRPGSARGPAQGDPAGGRRYPARCPGADGHVAGRGRPGPRRARQGGRRGRHRPARAGHHGRGGLHRGGGGGVCAGGRLLLDRHQRPDQRGAGPGPG